MIEEHPQEEGEKRPERRFIKRRNKEKENEELIEIAIKKVDSPLSQIQNEKAYDYLIRMGEANELCQHLGLNKTFRVYNKASGAIACHLYVANEPRDNLTEIKFEREFVVDKED